MLEWFELNATWVPVAIFVSTAVAGVISLCGIFQNRAQLKAQNKILSAKMSKELLEDWKKDTKFANLRFAIL